MTLRTPLLVTTFLGALLLTGCTAQREPATTGADETQTTGTDTEPAGNTSNGTVTSDPTAYTADGLCTVLEDLGATAAPQITWNPNTDEVPATEHFVYCELRDDTAGNSSVRMTVTTTADIAEQTAHDEQTVTDTMTCPGGGSQPAVTLSGQDETTLLCGIGGSEFVFTYLGRFGDGYVQLNVDRLDQPTDLDLQAWLDIVKTGLLNAAGATPPPIDQGPEAVIADGTWGGVTFPGKVGDYRLVSADEYASFAQRLEQGDWVCELLSDELTEYSGSYDGRNGSDGNMVYSLYTKTPYSLAGTDNCDFMGESLGISYDNGHLAGLYTGAVSDPLIQQDNGTVCLMTYTPTCGIDVPIGNFTGYGYSKAEEQMTDVSDAVAAVAEANS